MDDDNIRVTLARIDGNINAILAEVRSLCSRVDDHETRLRVSEHWCSISREKWSQHEDAHHNDRSITGVMAVIVTAVSSAIGVFVQKP